MELCEKQYGNREDNNNPIHQINNYIIQFNIQNIDRKQTDLSLYKVNYKYI